MKSPSDRTATPAGFPRNAWLASIGTGGWLASESVAGFVGIRKLSKWGKSPGGFGDGLHRSVDECQKMAEFRAYRSAGERMLHLRARTFAPLTKLTQSN